jgi:circadian clock protein KaiC
MLGGGLPRGYSLAGGPGPLRGRAKHPGRGLLAEGARCGETGVIAVFEQRPQPLAQPRARRPDRKRPRGPGRQWAPDLSIDEIVLLLLTEIRRLDASRVVIDSLSAFELALAPTFREDFRESLLRLVTALAAQASPC